jgi:hypothetical protein
MALDTITKQDLHQFKMELLSDIRRIIEPTNTKVTKPWLRNSEVRKLLNISSATLQRLRIAGRLPSAKIGGIYYYKWEDIERLMNKG